MRHRSLIALLLAFAVAMPACNKKPATVAPATTVQDYSYARLDEVAVTHMDMDLVVDFDHQVISGTAAFDLVNKSAAEVVHLDTWALRVST